MAKTLTTYIEGRNNNFNLIRFVAAVMVLVSHSYILSSGSGEFEPLLSVTGMSLSSIAVDVFFVISGFLITASILRRDDLPAFVRGRVLRIYPALVVAIIFCVFVVGLFFTTHSRWSYLTDLETIEFLIRNILLFTGVTHTLPGVFEGLPYPNAVNGSLWTLPCELLMYFIVGLLGTRLFSFNGRFAKGYPRYLLVCIFVLSFVAYVFAGHLMPWKLNMLARLFLMFFMGSTFYVFRDRIVLCGKVFVIMLLLLAVTLFIGRLFPLFYIFFIAYIVFYLAYIPSGLIRRFNDLGDYSYGMYIYAFPVQQSIVEVINGVSTGKLLILSFAVTLILSILSWNLVEKRALRLKGR